MLAVVFYLGAFFGFGLALVLTSAYHDHDLTPHDVEVLRHAASFWPDDSAGAREINLVADKLAARLAKEPARANA